MLYIVLQCADKFHSALDNFMRVEWNHIHIIILNIAYSARKGNWTIHACPQEIKRGLA